MGERPTGSKHVHYMEGGGGAQTRHVLISRDLDQAGMIAVVVLVSVGMCLVLLPDASRESESLYWLVVFLGAGVLWGRQGVVRFMEHITPRRFRVTGEELLCERASLFDAEAFQVSRRFPLRRIVALRPMRRRLPVRGGEHVSWWTELVLDDGERVRVCPEVADAQGVELASVLMRAMREVGHDLRGRRVVDASELGWWSSRLIEVERAAAGEGAKLTVYAAPQRRYLLWGGALLGALGVVLGGGAVMGLFGYWTELFMLLLVGLPAIGVTGYWLHVRRHHHVLEVDAQGGLRVETITFGVFHQEVVTTTRDVRIEADAMGEEVVLCCEEGRVHRLARDMPLEDLARLRELCAP